ncbi:hypothetical protein [Enterovirga aerilata]|uniref:Uncharacterized protein n=1 Tax=Enterovirga aerilata TaxID=2730920 RepID=A0A849ID12_9HYPH|nr:hypothetical protein [Enterovirga sp. DB1703]NNM73877.1 hypothetical protein [Enterovirga sp. DB1703]
MSTVRAWIDDWQAVLAGVEEGAYTFLTATHDDRDYRILMVSAFDRDIDGDKRAVTTPAKIFDRKVAYFTHRVRDTTIPRVITVRGEPKWVLEPGPECQDYAAAVEGISLRDLEGAVRRSTLGRTVARRLRRGEKRRRAILEIEKESLEERLRDAHEEIASLSGHLRHVERELAVYGAP